MNKSDAFVQADIVVGVDRDGNFVYREFEAWHGLMNLIARTLTEDDYEDWYWSIDEPDSWFECQTCADEGFVECREYYNDYVNYDSDDVMECPECKRAEWDRRFAVAQWKLNKWVNKHGMVIVT